MLREILDPRQIPGEAPRRWFSGTSFDLYVWHGKDGVIAGFQLCYGKPHHEKALTWKQDKGYSHTAVDDGEGSSGKYKETPMLVADGTFEAEQVAELFHAHSNGIEPAVAAFVLERIRGFCL